MYPHERSLVKKFEGKPFVILGVNSDPKERLKSVIKKENVTWRSWWDGGDTEGPIQKAWNIHSWPTTYVLDARGVIRFKDQRDEGLERAIESLLREKEQVKK